MKKLTQSKYLEYIKKFSETKILIVGDVMVDRFVYGNVSRISPEAPVPIVEVTKETYMSGGAGNVSSNIASYGGKVYLAGVIGDDMNGRRLIDYFKSLNINTDGIFKDTARPTTIKTRVIAQHQQVVRFDKESRNELSQGFTLRIINYIKDTIKNVDAILISDYGKGVIKPQLLTEIIKTAHKHNLPITVDPKVEHFTRYRNVTSITPNLQEAFAGMRIYKKDITEKDIKRVGQKILKELNCKSVIITRGEKGMAVFEKSEKILNIPTRAKEVFDVTCAGDTVIATLTLCLACGASIKTSAEIANFAAGIVVGKLGTATVSQEELKQAILNSRTLEP